MIISDLASRTRVSGRLKTGKLLFFRMEHLAEQRRVPIMLTTGLCGCESLGVVIAISGLSASVQADLQAYFHIISNTLVRLCCE